MGFGGVLRRVSKWTVGPLTLTLALKGGGNNVRPSGRRMAEAFDIAVRLPRAVALAMTKCS